MGRFLSTLVRYRVGPVRAIGVVAALGVWLATFCFLRDTLPFRPRVVLDADKSEGLIGFSADSRILLTCESGPPFLSDAPRGPLRLWDTATGRQIDEFFSPATDLYHAAITSDGRWLVVEEYSWPVIHIFDLETYKESGMLAAPRNSQRIPPYYFDLAPMDSESEPPALYLVLAAAVLFATSRRWRRTARAD